MEDIRSLDMDENRPSINAEGVGEPVTEGDLLGSAEIGSRLGVPGQRAHRVVGRPDFPEPIATLRQGRIWHTGDVEAWIEESRPLLRLMRALRS